MEDGFDMLNAESANYKIRPLVDSDFEEVKAIIKSSKYMGRLWDVEFLSENNLDDIVRDVFISEGCYAVLDKKTESFCGYLSSSYEDGEGELAVRMKEDVGIDEVMELFGKILKENAPTVGNTNLTIQYSYE